MMHVLHRVTAALPMKHTVTAALPMKHIVTAALPMKHTVTAALPMKHTVTAALPMKHGLFSAHRTLEWRTGLDWIGSAWIGLESLSFLIASFYLFP